ncbi:MAG: Na+:H+ antiporter, NhaC family [Halanaerobium sp.]|nr:MAG: Na+:H+ antiporter, NhaC family [Halanaerobium sp.]
MLIKNGEKYNIKNALGASLILIIIGMVISSSFGTIATIIVLLGVAEGLGVPKAVTVGAMLGDKISPMSDSTNLTAAMSSTDLFDHIKSMLYVSGPAALINLILYTIIGTFYLESGADLANINQILSSLFC